MRSKFSLGTKIYYKTRYGYGICVGYVVGLHDDFIRTSPFELGSSIVNIVRFEDVLSIFDE
jgi:hypothetical protein